MFGLCLFRCVIRVFGVSVLMFSFDSPNVSDPGPTHTASKVGQSKFHFRQGMMRAKVAISVLVGNTCIGK